MLRYLHMEINIFNYLILRKASAKKFEAPPETTS